MGEQFENYVRLKIDRRGLVAKQEFMWEKLKKINFKKECEIFGDKLFEIFRSSG